MALFLARLLATTRSCSLCEVRTGILWSLLSPISLLVRALGLRLLCSQAARPLRSSQWLGAHYFHDRALRFDYSRNRMIRVQTSTVPLLGLFFPVVIPAFLQYLRSLIAHRCPRAVAVFIPASEHHPPHQGGGPQLHLR